MVPVKVIVIVKTMQNNLTYDEAMDQYNQKAAEARQLIDYCHSCLTELEKGLKINS